MTRGWRDHKALCGQVSLLCIDEVHLLGEARGGTLEALVSRMRHVGRGVVAMEGSPLERGENPILKAAVRIIALRCARAAMGQMEYPMDRVVRDLRAVCV